MKFHNERIAEMTININKRYKLRILQVYAPTSTCDEEEIENFYEELDKAMNKNKEHFTILMGDFNAKIGKNINNIPLIGKFGLGNRNERGDLLEEFLGKQQLYIMNTFFMKKEKHKWTWRGPNGTTKNEIDYILTNKKHIVHDVSVINNFKFYSDHRLVCSTISINTKWERTKLCKKNRKNINTKILASKSKEFEIELKNRFDLLDNNHDDLDQHNTEITDTLLSAVKSIAIDNSVKKCERISEETKTLIKKRKTLNQDKNNISKIEYSELCKTIRKNIRQDIRKYNTNQIENTIKTNKNMKIMRRNLNTGRDQLLNIRGKDGNITSDPNKITKYIKSGGKILINKLTILYTLCLKRKMIPKAWNNATIIMIFKKGDKLDPKNYRPISLLSVLYKLFTKIITNRLTKQLDDQQPKEQAGFRSGYGTIDHIHTVNQLIEKSEEFQKPLCMAFIDYKKAFDSLKTNMMIKALKKQEINDIYLELIENIYDKATATIKLRTISESIKMERGIRQGDS